MPANNGGDSSRSRASPSLHNYDLEMNMKTFNGLLKKLLIITLTVGLLSACGGKEERKAKYLEKGKTYLAEENYDKASVEFRNVLQIDPKDAEGYYYLGLVQEKKKSWSGAMANFDKAVQLDPGLVDARVHLARLFLAQASAPAVRESEKSLANVMGLLQEQINEIRSRAPDSLDGLVLEATVWANDGEVDKAIAQLEQVAAKDPANRSGVVLLSGLYERAGRKGDAEAILEKAIASSDKSVVFQKRLSQIYTLHGKNDKAEAVLREIVKNDPGNMAARVDLASFLARTEQVDKAEQALRDTVAADPDDAQRYLLLAEFLAAKRDKQAAIDELSKAAADKPELTDLRFALVKLYLANEQRDEAVKALEDVIKQQGTDPAGLRARVILARLLAAADMGDERVPELIAEVLKENPGDNDALLVKGKLAAYQKNFAEAIGDFRSVLKDQPDSEEVLLLLSAAHLANGEKELAVDTLKSGVEINPGSVALHLRLANLLARQGDIDSALRQVDLVLKDDAKNQRALQVKFDLLARKGDAKGVEEVARLMQEIAPDKETGYIEEARLRYAQKDYDAAITLLDRALEKNPDSISAVLAKMDVLTAQKKYDGAMVLTDRLLEISPGIPEAYYRRGKLLQAQGKPEEAIKQYELVLEKAPDSAEALSVLIGLEVKEGRKEEAEKRLLDILKDNPQHASANGLLGILYSSNKDYAAAEKAFERQIEISPETASTYIQLSQSRRLQDDVEGAVAALQQGLEKLPDNVSLQLALAGMREIQKDYEAAISIYEKVLDQHPNNAVAVNNLAALLSDHRNDAASLEKAMELAAILEQSDQAAFLDTAGWVYYRKGDYKKAVEVLKKAVDSQPEVPVFQYHLGMAYFGLGDKSAAAEHLRKATTAEAGYDGIDEARETLKKLQ